MRISRKEWLFPLAIGLVVALLGTVPYVYAYLTQGPDEVFMGFVGRGTPGANGYFMLSRQALEGHWLFTNQMTPEPTKRGYFNLQWLLFGLFARWTGLSLVAVFHIGRILSDLAYMLAIYWLAAQCLDGTFRRRLALLLIAFGSGLGMLIWTANKVAGFGWPLPLDVLGVGMPGYLMNNPHFTRAGVSAALQYAFLIRGERTGRCRDFIYSGLAAEAHSMLRPYHVPETYAMYLLIPVLLCALERKHFRRRAFHYGAAMLIALPGAVYIVASAVSNVLGMAGWFRQSPLLIEQILWLGIPFLAVCVYFAIFGMTRLTQAKTPGLILGLWLAVAWLQCNTFPYFIAGHEQAFYALTIAPPILLFLGPLPEAYARLRQYVPRAATYFDHAGNRRRAAAALLIACMPSSAYVYARFFQDLHHPVGEWRYYLRKDAYDAIAWLDAHAQPDDVVLASQATSQFIPRMTRCKVVTGHDMLTANYGEKNALVDRFFRVRYEDGFKLWMAMRYSTRYVFTGPDETFPEGIVPKDHPWLVPVHQAGGVTIYKIG